jgi:indole-3-glycerol phosphate synthase
MLVILDEIVAHKRVEVAAEKARIPLEQHQEQITRVAKPRDFRAALRAPGISLIAEIKRHSPSKGDILPDVDAVDLAALYEHAGARALSILTDQKYFKGSIEDLRTVRRHVAIPCLRKEFIIDPYQIYEARAVEADAILLIVRVLSDEELKEYLAVAKSLGMAALVETHDEKEIERAVEAGAVIVGINNRNLDTLEIDVANTFELKRRVPGGHTLVSESGIHTREQVRALEEGGVEAILVGESLLTSKDIRGKIEELLGHGEG